MSKVWRRGRPTRGDDVTAGLAAGAAAVAVGAATFYLTRLFLARTPVELAPPTADAPTALERETVRRRLPGQAPRTET